MIMATIPDRNSTITSEFMMLAAKGEKGWIQYSPVILGFYQQT